MLPRASASANRWGISLKGENHVNSPSPNLPGRREARTRGRGPQGGIGTRSLLQGQRGGSVRPREFAPAGGEQLHRGGRADQGEHRRRPLSETAQRRRRLHGDMPMRQRGDAGGTQGAGGVTPRPRPVGTRFEGLSRGATSSPPHGG